MPPMTQDAYAAAQTQLLLFVRLLQDLPLEAMQEAITHAHSVAPIIDPTLYGRGMDNLWEIERLVGALQRAQQETQAPFRNLRGWAARQLAEAGQAHLVDWEAIAE